MSRLRSGASVQSEDRQARYYRQARPEVAALVPPECRRVLDVGCAAGDLGRLLKERGHQVSGVELVPEAAARARQWLDGVEVADVEAEGFPFPKASFDAVVFADVLEHFVDPWRVLREATALLSSKGCIVASIPNVQNFDVLRRLALGRWAYRDRGILDFGHLRFFTLQTIRDLFKQAGLMLSHVTYHYRHSWLRTLACFLTGGLIRPYLCRQYLVVGTKS